MSTKERNWWIGLGTILTVAAVIIWSAIWLATPAGGGAPTQAGPVVRVMVGLGHGSGVHIGNGLILTAEHVVASAASAPTDKPVAVTIRDDRGNEFVADILWASARSDIALVKIPLSPEASPPEASQLVCRQIVVGEPVMVSGNPSSMQFARSWGRISTGEQAISRWHRAVATDVAALPGSSGGPVFDEAGQLIGIVVGMTNPAGFIIIVPARVICDLLAR